MSIDRLAKAAAIERLGTRRYARTAEKLKRLRVVDREGKEFVDTRRAGVEGVGGE
jgi:hypothetical protein